MFRKPVWSPYICGVLIGLLQIPAYLVISKGLGTASSYVKISGHILNWLGISFENGSYLYKYTTRPDFLWQLCLIIGITVGAFISSKLSGVRRSSISPVWGHDFHLTPGTRYFLAFLGGFFMLFGARFAGGCPTGHGITGVAQLSLGSIVSTAVTFLSAIIFAHIWKFSTRRKF